MNISAELKSNRLNQRMKQICAGLLDRPRGSAGILPASGSDLQEPARNRCPWEFPVLDDCLPELSPCNNSKLFLAVMPVLLFMNSASVAADLQTDGRQQNEASHSHLKMTEASNEYPGKLILKPGQPVSVGMQAQDICVTDDVNIAREQAAAFPDSPDASFILAVCLTRTSMVEQALAEVRRARRLAEKEGGPIYFDKMIGVYEDMLKDYPNDNRLRYGLAWAYYMKAYVLAKYSKGFVPPVISASTDTKIQTKINAPAQAGSEVTARLGDQQSDSSLPIAVAPIAEPAKASAPATVPISASVPAPTTADIPAKDWRPAWVSALAAGSLGFGVPSSSPANATQPQPSLPYLKGALEQAPPTVVPQIRAYYQAALNNLDELLKRNPNDVWALVYRAFLNAEYTGDLSQAMEVWRVCQIKYPDNPAPYFFLGEGYLKQGNLKESLHNISQAVALRASGR